MNSIDRITRRQVSYLCKVVYRYDYTNRDLDFEFEFRAPFALRSLYACVRPHRWLPSKVRFHLYVEFEIIPDDENYPILHNYEQIEQQIVRGITFYTSIYYFMYD